MTAVTAMHAAPEWSTIVGREISCPLCGYNLRGLVEPRCPECGFAFDWDAVIHPAQVHAYLFEYRRGVIAFARTLLATHSPERFWTALNPTLQPRAQRLASYWVLATSLMLVVPASMVLWYFQAVTPSVGRWDRDQLLDGVNSMIATQRPVRASLLFGLAVIAVWPLLSAVLLQLLFRISLRRGRIRAGHVWRCALYSGDSALWVACVAAFLDGSEPQRVGLFIAGKWVTMICVAIVLASFTAARLGIACDRYLRLDHPRAVVLATQVILLLVILLVALQATLAKV
jgi:hypothetical protein